MKKIMLVDDVAIANFIMKKMIALVMPDATVADYTLPTEALDQIIEFRPDLIFLDLNMPDMNGFQFLDGMNALGLDNTVIILSSSTSEVDMQQTKRYKQVRGYFIKPIEKEMLQNILAKL